MQSVTLLFRLIPWGIGLTEKLMVSQVVTKFPGFCWTQRFTTVYHVTLAQISWIKSIPTPIISLRSILIWSFILWLVLFPSSSPIWWYSGQYFCFLYRCLVNCGQKMSYHFYGVLWYSSSRPGQCWGSTRWVIIFIIHDHTVGHRTCNVSNRYGIVK